MDTSFLASERFWAVVINAATFYLQQKGIIGEAELTLITAIVAPFVVIGTVDRLGKNIGKTELQSKEDIKEDNQAK